MAKPIGKQRLQDWLTQFWVLQFGQQIEPNTNDWLLGPFGSSDQIGPHFISEITERENLERAPKNQEAGLLSSIHDLKLSAAELNQLAPEIIDFYEHTAAYDLSLEVNWNRSFLPFGTLVKWLFSRRIQQLNIPTSSNEVAAGLTNELIQLRDPKSKAIKRTFWYRTLRSTGEVVYSGIYGTSQLPNGKRVVKAVFPLPHGNATVLLLPSVQGDGSLRLSSAGKKIGDSGFYFLLEDDNGHYWTKFIRSFKDELHVFMEKDELKAVQKLTLWSVPVLSFCYSMTKKPQF
jgi:hypothetical protein